MFEIVLDPERAQIEKLEPTLFDIVLRPEQFISESSLEDESDYLEEIPAALIPLLSAQEPKEEQQPLDPNDYDQFRYNIQVLINLSRYLNRGTKLSDYSYEVLKTRVNVFCN